MDDALAGRLVLRPGAQPPQIRSSRRALVRSLTQGKPARELPELLGSLFALCGQAHRLTAQRALAAAGLAKAASDHSDARALQLDTLREQLRRLWLDWPLPLRGQPVEAGELQALCDCPALKKDLAPDAALAAMPAWLSRHLLGGSAPAWLRAWESEPQAALSRWCESAATLPAALLRRCRDEALAITHVPSPLALQADTQALSALAQRLQEDADFAMHPDWQGEVFETGPWTRQAQADPEQFTSAWLRLGARLAECVRLSLPDVPGRSGAGWLCAGALALGPRQGLAWCEMARGLLLHRVALDRKGGIAACDVLAPTEWNFHPRGAVAQQLAGMAEDAPTARIELLAAAYDPCVQIQIERCPHA